ncbi:MAG: hypothetical protein MZV64_71325 [Ignavibacteriales bacterium]|nr:hypothetical protein [Ignavibacteriales bacterium]
MSTVVKDDLTMTGLFECISDAAQIERPDQPFLADRWRASASTSSSRGRWRAERVLPSSFRPSTCPSSGRC